MVAWFYLLALGITWAAWLPQTAHARGWAWFGAEWWSSPVLYVLGGLGPGIAAYLLIQRTYGEAGLGRLRRLLAPRDLGGRWVVAASLVVAGIWVTAGWVAGAILSDLLAPAAWVGAVPGFIVYLVAAIPDEVGWRGFAQTHLQHRFSALGAGVMVGGMWALWHLPLRLNPDQVAPGSDHLAWVGATVAAGVVYAWLFNPTASVLAVTVLHAVSNSVSRIVEGVAPDAAGYAAIGLGGGSCRAGDGVRPERPVCSSQTNLRTVGLCAAGWRFDRKAHVIKALLIAVIAAAVTVAVLPGVGAAQEWEDANAVDAFVVEQMEKHRVPGVAVAILEDGEVSYLKGYGASGKGNPVTADTPFVIGSISKSFTAVAILQLVEDGLVDLDAPVRSYLPSFEVADETATGSITVRHFLHHTSGLSELGYNRASP